MSEAIIIVDAGTAPRRRERLGSGVKTCGVGENLRRVDAILNAQGKVAFLVILSVQWL